MKSLITFAATILAVISITASKAQGVIDETIQIASVTPSTATTGTISFTVAARQGLNYATVGGLNVANLRYDAIIVTSPVGGTFSLSNSSGTLTSVNTTIITGGVTNATTATSYSPQGTPPAGTNAFLGFTLLRNSSSDPDLPASTSTRATLFTVTYNYTITSGYTVNTTGSSVVQRATTGTRGSSWSSQTSVTGNAFTQGVATALPLELTEFNASNNGDNRSLLQWATVKEQNTAFFDVERSANGDNFNAIVAHVRAAGKSSSLLKYQSYDEQPLAGANYYRLKMVDADGKYTYSAIRKVVFNGKSPEVVVYPTENYDGLVHVNLPQEWAEAQLHLYNVAGQLVAAPVDGIGLTRTVQLTSLPAGVYTLKVADTKNSQAFRISYQR